MSISESYTERLDRDLRSITEPLMEQLRDIEGEIESMTSELSELRAHRTKLVGIVRSIDPELAPKKEQPKKKDNLISDSKVNEVYEWLKANLNGDEFYASGLMKDDRYEVTSQSQTAKALGVLHERGQILLVRQGSGGSKHFRLVGA
jgi:hypothetical protein